MTKILSEEKVQKLLKGKMITLESYKESSSPPQKNEEETVSEDKWSQEISRQTAAIEKLCMLLHQNFVAILQTGKADSLGPAIKDHLERLEEILAERKSAKPVKWRFKIHRNDHGRIESVEAEPTK